MGGSLSQGVFKNGTWGSYYFQNGQWIGPFHHSIYFDAYRGMLHGYGRDHVGEFSLLGIYSPERRLIRMTQYYHPGTGHPYMNHGQKSRYRLHWSPSTSAFIGEYDAVNHGIAHPAGFFHMYSY